MPIKKKGRLKKNGFRRPFIIYSDNNPDGFQSMFPIGQ